MFRKWLKKFINSFKSEWKMQNQAKEQERIRQESMEKNTQIIQESVNTVAYILTNREQEEQEFKKLVKELEELDEMAKELGIGEENRDGVETDYN